MITLGQHDGALEEGSHGTRRFQQHLDLSFVRFRSRCSKKRDGSKSDLRGPANPV